MDFFGTILNNDSPLNSILVLALICAIGSVLGKIKIAGISLGVSFVFFVGILAGHLGLEVNSQVLLFTQTFGLVLFIYTLGLQVGPGFFSSFGRKSVRLNLIGLVLITIGTLMAILFSSTTNVSLPNMIGVLCGATTNTPALGAAQQTLSQMGLPINSMALSCAVTYPLGVIGVILAIMVMRKFVAEERLEPKKHSEPKETFLATFIVTNNAIIGKTIQEIAALSDTRFVISRLWRNGAVTIPVSDTRLIFGDRVLVVTTNTKTHIIKELFGEQESADWNNENIDWNEIDSRLSSKNIIITKPEINGKRLGSLRLRNSYGVNITRVYRSGVLLLATADLVLQMGDRLVIVGAKEAIKNVEKLLGNAEQRLNDPNLAPIFIGILLGVLLGSIPLMVPGMSAPISLGMAGGPIIMGMIIGTFGPRIHMITYTTRSANLMLRGLGLSLFLACLGLDSGKELFDIVLQPEGAEWVGLGFLITVVPVLIVGFASYFLLKMDFGTICGMLCGSMANPMALNYANDIIPGDSPSIAYATVYPLGMFVRVIIAQAVLITLL